MSLSPLDKLAAARYLAHRKCPWLASCLFTLRWTEAPGIGTIGCDKWHRVYFDPAVVESWPLPALTGAIVHECLHLVFRHHARGAGDKTIANVAGDLAINPMIAESELTLPRGALHPQMFGMPPGLLMEEYIPLVEAAAKAIPGAAIGAGKCGSCAGEPLPCEAPSDEGCISEERSKIIARQVAGAARQAGNAPAALKAWAEQLLGTPKVPWQRILSQMCRRMVHEAMGMDDFTFAKLSRKWAALRATGEPLPFLPSMYSPTPAVAVVLDASGSMMGGPQAAARTEIAGIVRALRAPTHVLVADVEVAQSKKVFSTRDILSLGETGGGTDMRVGIRAASKLAVSLIIVVTDGETPWPAKHEMPSIPVIACIISGPTPPAHIRHVPITL